MPPVPTSIGSILGLPEPQNFASRHCSVLLSTQVPFSESASEVVCVLGVYSPRALSAMSVISVSKSTLMHASLAYISPEIQALDDTIFSRTTPTLRTSLPTEIILLIRDHLFEMITMNLIKQSEVALEAYEQSLTELLCSDCITYNFDIYGPDIWQWDHFSGACACISAGSGDSRRTTHKGAMRHSHDHGSQWVQGRTSIPNPRQFIDRQHWLETHLSCQMAALPVKWTLRHPHSMSSVARSLAPSSVDIWDVVNLVLEEYDCEAVRMPEDMARTLQSVGRGQISSERDSVQINPVRHHTDSSTGFRPELSPLTLIDQAQVVLRCASRDLRITLEYPNIFGTRKPFPTQQRRPLSVSDRWHDSRVSFAASDTLLYALTGFMGICFSLPLAFATAIITVWCFYSKPRSLRIF